MRHLTQALAKVPPRHVVLVVLLVLGAIRRFGLPGVPFADGDLIGYLLPAIDLLEHGQLTHHGTRSFLYPLWVAGLIKLTGTVAAVPFVQHLLGLATGLLIFMMFEGPLFGALRQGWYRWGVSLVQLWCTAYFLLASSIWQYEHYISSQALSTFLLTAQLYLLVGLVRQGTSQKRTLLRAGTLVFLALVTYMLMPRMGFALPVIGLIAVGELYFSPIPAKKWLVALALPVVLFVLAIWLPERHLVNQYDKGTDYFPFRQFFYIHADMAKTLVQADLAAPHAAYDKPTLRAIDSILVLPTENQHFRYLGFDADTMFIGGYDTQVIAVLENRGHNYMYFILHYDKRILAELPGRYLLKIADQLQHYYIGADGYGQYWVDEHSEFFNVRDVTLDMVNRPQLQGSHIMAQYRAQARQQLSQWQWASRFQPMQTAIDAAKHAFVPMLLVFLVQLVFLATLRIPTTAAYRHLVRLALYCILIQFALVLTVAAIHSFDIYRYGVWFVPVTIMVQGLVALCILQGWRGVPSPNGRRLG